MDGTATVLLTGATGYIGGRLLRRLEDGGHNVRCLARHPEKVTVRKPTTEVVPGDCLDEPSLGAALAGVHTAYYLVHSMASGSDFAELDHRAAANFGSAAKAAGVARIVYLGGLVGDAGSLSAHLKSRAETGDTLRQSGVPVIEFRASIVIGAGSLSFEMISALVERLPAMVCPRWVDTPTQPIAVDDVLTYLELALDVPDSRDHVFEIGGPQVVSYADMMREYARLRGLRRLLIPVSVLTPHLSGMWLALVTPAQARVGRALVEGLKNATVVRSPAAREAFPAVSPMPLQAAFTRAIEEGFTARRKLDTRSAVVDVPPALAFAPVRRIGGASGWYFGNLLWRTRGWLDLAFGGTGMPRHRRHPDECESGDLIDGWKVEHYEPDRHLRMSAGLRLPGRGWLEFEVTPIDGGTRSLIRQTASFDPRGVLGRAYWYAVLPIHSVLFRGLLRRITQIAERDLPRSTTSLFAYRSILTARAADVFRWHERPEALVDLMPKGLARIESRTGGLRDGGRVTLSVGLGPARMYVEARHFGYIAGLQFCDEQVRGPFKLWRHTHRTEALDPWHTLYEDRVEYAVAGGPRLNRVVEVLLRPLLTAAFASRHRVVRARTAAARIGRKRHRIDSFPALQRNRPR